MKWIYAKELSQLMWDRVAQTTSFCCLFLSCVGLEKGSTRKENVTKRKAWTKQQSLVVQNIDKFRMSQQRHMGNCGPAAPVVVGGVAEWSHESHLKNAEPQGRPQRRTLWVNYVLEKSPHPTAPDPHTSHFVFHSIIKQHSFSWVASLQELYLLTNSPADKCCVLMYYIDGLYYEHHPL